MKVVVRLLMALFASAGILAWANLAVAGLWATILGRSDQGSGGASSPVELPMRVLEVFLLVLPMAAFVFILLGSFNLPKGILRNIGYWYSLAVLVALAGLFFTFSRGLPRGNWIWLAPGLAAVVWGLAFRSGRVGP